MAGELCHLTLPIKFEAVHKNTTTNKRRSPRV